MVITDVESSENRNKNDHFIMAMVPERSRNLHNFSLPSFKWGRQRQLRCIKVDNGGTDPDHFASSLHHRRRSPSHHLSGVCKESLEIEKKRRSFCDQPPDFKNSASPASGSRKLAIGGGVRVKVDGDDIYDGGIEEVRKKLVQDLQTEVDKMKVAMFSERNEENEPSPTTQPQTMSTEVAAVETRQWNLRTRRAVSKEPNGSGDGAGGGGKIPRVDGLEPNSSSFKATYEVKSSRFRGEIVGGGGGGVSCNVGERMPRAKFTIPLSRKAIEEDFYEMLGSKPPRKPKKRSRTVQRQLDTLFPGLWLTEITPDMYKVKVNERHGGGKSLQ